jgi:hypothetical protein
MDSPAEEDGFEPSVPREKDGEKADESISQLSLAGSVNAAGTRCLHFGKMRVQANGNSYLHGHRWGLGRNVTGSSQRSPLYAAETPRCLHFGKMRVQASGNSFPAYKREASPTDADGRQDHHACG